MPRMTVIWKNGATTFFLKVLYLYAGSFGMLFFTITDRGFLKFSKKTWIFSISYLSMCSLGYMCVLFYANKDVFQTSNFIRGISFVKYSAKIVFMLALIKFQLKYYTQFIETVNKSLKCLVRITMITRELRVFGREFYSMVLGRVLSDILLFATDAPNLIEVSEFKDPVFVVQNCLGYILTFVTLITLDVVFLVFTTASRMYVCIGNHMVTFADRVQKFENSFTNLARRKTMFQKFCVELEDCSRIYSDIFKTTLKFHAMLQLIILLNFNFTLISVISGVHVCFVNYLKFGQIMWFLLTQITIQLLNLLGIILCADLMVQRSKIPQSINWESLLPEFDEQWDKCVYQFLAQLRLEDLNINVFELFSLNHELCLRVLSMIIGYLTILVQFSMMGYFKEDS